MNLLTLQSLFYVSGMGAKIDNRANSVVNIALKFDF